MATIYIDDKPLQVESEAEPAAPVSVAGFRSALFLLASRAGLGGRMPPMRSQAIQG